VSAAKLFVLIGHPVGHSVSPAIHGAAYRLLGAGHRYEVVDCPSEQDVRRVVDRLRRGELAGANVTVPWKRLALALADRSDDSARETGVANVLSCDAGGAVTASNTDARALADEIRALHGAPRSAAVIGAGGAAQAAVVACKMLGVREIHVSNRDWLDDKLRAAWKRADELAALGATPWVWPSAPNDPPNDLRPLALSSVLKSTDVIVQATSAGMRGAGPGEAVSDWIPWRELAPGAVAIDVVYNPPRTPFLEAAERASVPHAGGLGMLVRQAALAIQIWLGGDEGWAALDLAELRRAAERALEAQRHP
jgi:shikimate dehydrogenase